MEDEVTGAWEQVGGSEVVEVDEKEAADTLSRMLPPLSPTPSSPPPFGVEAKAGEDADSFSPLLLSPSASETVFNTANEPSLKEVAEEADDSSMGRSSTMVEQLTKI